MLYRDGTTGRGETNNELTCEALLQSLLTPLNRDT